MRVVVRQHPGEDGVLHQVIVGAAGQRVEVHQVLEVADLAALEVQLLQLRLTLICMCHYISYVTTEYIEASSNALDTVFRTHHIPKLC